MNRKLVVGNWKMNGRSASNRSLLEALVSNPVQEVDAVVCVPSAYLGQAGALLANSSVGLGAQNVSERPDGAVTGEISAGMLVDLGCSHVIVGHSERRACFGESDDLVAAKAGAAFAAGLVPIFCIGETLEQRDGGAVEKVLQRQLAPLLERADAGLLERVVIAYEPVWAIGTGRSAEPVEVQEVLAFVRKCLSLRSGEASGVRILYGGSVKASSAFDLFGLPDCDGGLIGGASLVADEFLAICRAAAAVSNNGSVNE